MSVAFLVAQVQGAKRQVAEELQGAKDQLHLHSQLLHEQDQEVHKLRRLLEAQHGQMQAQEQQHIQDVTSLQDCIQEQQQHAAQLQQAAVLQEAKSMHLSQSFLVIAVQNTHPCCL